MRWTYSILLSLAVAATFGVVAMAGCSAAEEVLPPAEAEVGAAFAMTRGVTMIDFAWPWEVFEDPHLASGGMQLVQEHTSSDAPIVHIPVLHIVTR